MPDIVYQVRFAIEASEDPKSLIPEAHHHAQRAHPDLVIENTGVEAGEPDDEFGLVPVTILVLMSRAGVSMPDWMTVRA